MVRNNNSAEFRLIYSLGEHPYLGFLIEPHIVYLNKNGTLSLSYRRIFSHTIEGFNSVIDETDKAIIALLDEVEQSNIIKKYHKKHIRPVTYFSEVYDDELHEVIRPKIEEKLIKALGLLKDKPLYRMSKDGYPADSRIEIATEATSILFHFRRDEKETRYFPTLKYKGERLEFMYKNAEVIINEQAWLLLGGTLYYFDEELEGKKLTPFLNKRFISVQRNTEKRYFESFVKGLIEKHHVYAQGFQIKTHRENATPILSIRSDGEKLYGIKLNFKYGEYTFGVRTNDETGISVYVEHLDEEDMYIFHRIRRSTQWEQNKEKFLQTIGLSRSSNLFSDFNLSDQEDTKFINFLDWLNSHHETLAKEGFVIDQIDSKKKYVIGKTSLEMSFDEQHDWFDVKAYAQFGEFKVAFVELREYILNEVREYMLPNGYIAIIPEPWFAKYKNVFQFSLQKNNLKLSKRHIGLINEVTELNETVLERKLEKLLSFEEIPNLPIPKGFKGELRSYQQAGYNWFMFLQEYNFGGCLADDMGLGKTVQTLALLQHEKEKEELNQTITSLLILPTSLIYNWYNEAKRFTPKLKILLHTGYNREKDTNSFVNYDLVITTYGVVRSDQEFLKECYFNYIILDESQNIKNHTSKSFQAIMKLKSRYKLALSGTPVENSVSDLWSQMHFLNPGLLGSHSFFQKEFVQPIEKKKDENKAARLQAIVKPFIMRRTKDQVASELPPKTEQVIYCQQTEEQQYIYESTKSKYRNAFFEGELMQDGAASQIAVLQGLTQLRLMANHPVLADQDFEGTSGKFEAACGMLEAVIAEKSKALVFSQFVRHLQLFRNYLDKRKIPYAYLDGTTTDRMTQVELFKKNEDVQVFLISIKAGGVGLNLTEAEYVFILDPWWNPAVEQQAVDRTHRIGQTKNVFIYKFISKDTVEEKILFLQERKKSLASSLITTEESFMKSLTKEELRDILN